MASTVPQGDTAKLTSNDPQAGSSASAGATKPQLSALIEDDEFEEFPQEDWDDSEADLSGLAKGIQGSGEKGKVTMKDLWEDNWDDDVVESDFAHQLRQEIAKTKSGTGVAPMQT